MVMGEENKTRVVYMKITNCENGIIFTTQRVGTVIHKDQYDSVTVKVYNKESKDSEILTLRYGEYSTTPFLMDFD